MKPLLKVYFDTTAANMPHGSGYWEIYAANEDMARKVAFRDIPDGRWCFLYDNIEKVHPFDRKCHGVLHE